MRSDKLPWDDHKCRPLPPGTSPIQAGCPAPLVNVDGERRVEMRLKTKDHKVSAFFEFCDPKFVANNIVPATNYYARVRGPPLFRVHCERSLYMRRESHAGQI
jgi:hypothetical protein